MKKYVQRAQYWFLALTLLSFVCIVAGVVLRIFSYDSSQFIWLLILPILMFLLFFPCYIAAARSYLLIDSEKIVFPVTRSPKTTLKRNTVLFSDIAWVEERFSKGDFVSQTLDTYYYTFHMKSGDSFTETLFPYGKKQEVEIVSILKSRVKYKPE